MSDKNIPTRGLLIAAVKLIRGLADAADIDLQETTIDVNAVAPDGSARLLAQISANEVCEKCLAAAERD